MKRTILSQFAMVVVGIVLGLSIAIPLGGSAANASSSAALQYKVLLFETNARQEVENILNKRGKDGWKLITISQIKGKNLAILIK